MILLGIDPGSRITGFGVLEVEGKHSRYLASGCIHVQNEAMPQRLGEIFHGVSEIIKTYHPDTLVIERVFLHRNADSALKLGQARGAALVAAVDAGLAVHEYSPNEIKQAIVGRGHADKAQIQHMIKVLLGLSETPPSDAADALALALCHAHHRQYQQAVKLATHPAAGPRRGRGGWRQYKPPA
jgi:crossover junction endodeoxyribonuclease RuvC